MIHYRFNEIKTAQLGAYLIQAEGRPLKYIKLLKLMYLADREALRRFARPITGDRAVAMRHGPVLSNVYNLIGDDPEVGETYWSRHIKQTQPYYVSVDGDPGVGALSDAELEIAREVSQRFQPLNEWQTVQWCHEHLAEWKDPGDTSVPIDYETILIEGLKLPPEEVSRIEAAALDEATTVPGEVNLEELLGPIVLDEQGSPKLAVEPFTSGASAV